MIEIPEAVVISNQINETLTGKQIQTVIANQSPHIWAWFTGDPARYPEMLESKTIGLARPVAGNVEVNVDDYMLCYSTNLRFYRAGEKLPPKHQLLLKFTDSTAFCATVQMWGGMFCTKKGEKVGLIDVDLVKQNPSPLSEEFDRSYFNTLFDEKSPKLSAKAFLATEQRIPGLGNGVLQDILWTARLHPKKKIASLTDNELETMYHAVKGVLHKMTAEGGRDTEIDIFGQPGGYKTILSRNTVGKPCPSCSTTIRKEAYMGGSIYYCPSCQVL
jgi:formamidopyrimidine-DNA glycosylase